MSRNGSGSTLAGVALDGAGAESQIAAIVARMNIIRANPLHRREAEQLRRAYTAAVVRLFDERRMAAGRPSR